MRIQTKVFLTILLSSIALVLLMVQLLQWSLDKGLVEYANERQKLEYQPIVEELESYYVERGGWSSLEGNRRYFDNLIAQYVGEPRQRRRESRPPPGPRGESDRRRRAPESGRRENRPGEERPPPKPITLLNKSGRMIVGSRQDLQKAMKVDIKVEGELVGFLVFPDNQKLASDFELHFIEQQKEALFLAGFIVIFLAGISAFLFAPTIVRPIKKIAAGSHELIMGNYDGLLNESRRDEIGDLAKDINLLTRTLEKNEQMRQRWLADTSHELRTPLAIIKAEIEAMLDGVRSLSHENLTSVSSEVNHLHKLIDDLADLSNMDLGSLRYRKEMLDLRELLLTKEPQIERACEARQLTFQSNPGPAEVIIWADGIRINQMLDNLVTNSCKYTDSPGKVKVRLETDMTNVRLVVEDSGPGVPDEALPRLFEHLYRVESSRNRNTGGSGLGLSIASKIVEGHGGSIEASHAEIGGLKITITLPLARPDDV